MLRDLRFALRRLLRSPGFSATSCLQAPAGDHA
jgi:hypothetical protein